MDICENEMPATELNNEMPVSGDDMENGEDRHVVNGDSYASRAARTVSYEYHHDRKELDTLKMLCPSGQEPRFLHQVRIHRRGRSLKPWSKPKATRRKLHVCKER